MWLQFLEPLVVENSFNAIFWFASAFTWGLFVASGTEKTTNLVEKVWPFKANILAFHLILCDNVTLLGNSLCSNNVVSGNHTHGYTSSLNLSDSSWDFWANNVHDTQNANQSETSSLDVLNVFIFRFVMTDSVFIRRKVFVAKSNSTQGLFSISFNHIFNGAANSII